MKDGGSLRFRLLLGAALWIGGALLVAGFILTDLFRRHVETQAIQGMEAQLEQLLASVDMPVGSRPVLTRPLATPGFRKPYSGLYWQVSTADGKALLRSRSLWDEFLSLPPDRLFDGQVHRHETKGPDGRRLVALERAVRFPQAADTVFRLAVARDEDAFVAPVMSFARTLAVSLAVLALGLMVAAGAQVRLGLRPMERLRNALAQMQDKGEGARLEGDYPSEVTPLVHDLNALVAHNEEVVQRARTQAGNLAHGIKTPLAVLANEADSLELRGEKKAAEVIHQQLSLAGRYVDYHLTRARTAGGGGSARLTPVLDSLKGITRVMERLFAERGIKITVDVDAQHLFRGERQDLEEMLGNLVENACKWAATQVEVHSRLAGQSLILVIDDDGPGIPPDNREAVFDRGRRFDESAPGSGLGLAIVRDIADLHGGSIGLSESPLGGLRAELHLPGRSGAARPVG